jgi:hypothetical protein
MANDNTQKIRRHPARPDAPGAPGGASVGERREAPGSVRVRRDSQIPGIREIFH